MPYGHSFVWSPKPWAVCNACEYRFLVQEAAFHDADRRSAHQAHRDFLDEPFLNIDTILVHFYVHIRVQPLETCDLLIQNEIAPAIVPQVCYGQFPGKRPWFRHGLCGGMQVPHAGSTLPIAAILGAPRQAKQQGKT